MIEPSQPGAMTEFPSGPAANLLAFAVYDRPREHPTAVVVRAWDLASNSDKPLPAAWTFADVEAARDKIKAARPEATRVPRDPDEPASVVESWY